MLNGNGSVDTSTRHRVLSAPPAPGRQVAARLIAVIELRPRHSRVRDTSGNQTPQPNQP
jgi:hypothetical protein